MAKPIPWKYRMNTATPVYPDRGVTPDGFVGWIRIERWRTNIVDNVIGEEVEHVELTPKQLSDACGAPVAVIQVLMQSARYSLDYLRDMCAAGEKNIDLTTATT